MQITSRSTITEFLHIYLSRQWLKIRKSLTTPYVSASPSPSTSLSLSLSVSVSIQHSNNHINGTVSGTPRKKLYNYHEAQNGTEHRLPIPSFPRIL